MSKRPFRQKAMHVISFQERFQGKNLTYGCYNAVETQNFASLLPLFSQKGLDLSSAEGKKSFFSLAIITMGNIMANTHTKRLRGKRVKRQRVAY